MLATGYQPHLEVLHELVGGQGDALLQLLQVRHYIHRAVRQQRDHASHHALQVPCGTQAEISSENKIRLCTTMPLWSLVVHKLKPQAEI